MLSFGAARGKVARPSQKTRPSTKPNTCIKQPQSPQWAIFEISNIRLDSEAVRTKTVETSWNECEKYLHIIHFPLSLSLTLMFLLAGYFYQLLCS